MTETKTIIEAIHSILSKVGVADKIKIVKLIYLADKYHLIHYGRTLSNDTYFAMEYGPVGSTVKDILSFNDFTLSTNEMSYANELLKKISENGFKAKQPEVKCEYDMLFETDKEALDFIINEFGTKTQWELRDYTHEYPEWNQHADLFRESRASRMEINTKELLSTLKDDPLGMNEEHIKESEKMLTGMYD